MNNKKSISIFGVTGDIGGKTLEVIEQDQSKFSVHTISANKNVKLLAEIAIKFRVKRAIIMTDSLYKDLKNRLTGTNIEVVSGDNAVKEDITSSDVDCFIFAIPTIASASLVFFASQRQNKIIGVASKEAIVCAGRLIMQELRKSNSRIVPIDSEHNAVFQLLENHNQKSDIKKILITCSGGSFFNYSYEDMKKITPKEALIHPTWNSMGNKVTMDSSTMVNKALEVIEACYLFSMPDDLVEVIIHPECLIHAALICNNNAIFAHISEPDMKNPISHVLSWPDTATYKSPEFSFLDNPKMTFAEVDHNKFPAINMAREALKQGQHATLIFNSANEVAVEYFFKSLIKFTDIYKIIENAMIYPWGVGQIGSITEVLELDTVVKKTINDNLPRFLKE